MLIVFLRQKDLPVASVVAAHGMGLAIPPVEVAGEEELLGSGGPFAVDPAVSEFVEMEAIVFMHSGKFQDASREVGDRPDSRLVAFVALDDGWGERRQPRLVSENR